jgi:MFS family permease
LPATSTTCAEVLTPVGVLDRDKQLGVVRELTDIVAAAGEPKLTERTWVLITESPDGSGGLQGHANTSADIVAAARRELAGEQASDLRWVTNSHELTQRAAERGDRVAPVIRVISNEHLPDGPPGRSGRLSSPIAFGAISAIFVLFAAAASAPTPLYVVYQKEFGFSNTTLTVIFAVYVFGLIASLLILGGLSDHVGRRPVLAAAIALEAVAFVLFIAASDVTVLLVARVAQGIATGAAFSTLGATLVDLNPPDSPGRAGLVNGVAPLLGLALGSVGTGALIQFAPAPTQLVFALLLAGTGVAGVVIARLPETSARRPDAIASLVPLLGIPARLRADVYALVPIIVAQWALGGLYLSLGPSVAASLFGLHNHLVGGLVVTLLCGAGALTAFLLRTWPTNRVLGISGILLSAGTALTLAGVEAHSTALAGTGTVVAGVGFGASALASFGTLARIAAPGERSELLAVALVIAYLAFSLPALGAGFASTTFGLHATTVVYSLGVVALGLVALAAQGMRSARLRVSS